MQVLVSRIQINYKYISTISDVLIHKVLTVLDSGRPMSSVRKLAVLALKKSPERPRTRDEAVERILTNIFKSQKINC